MQPRYQTRYTKGDRIMSASEAWKERMKCRPPLRDRLRDVLLRAAERLQRDGVTSEPPKRRQPKDKNTFIPDH